MRGHGAKTIRHSRVKAAATAALLAAACTPAGLWLHDQSIDGPYRLRAVADAGDMHICYNRRTGSCDLRIPGRVFAIAYDEHFIAAAVRPAPIGSEKVFYYIVREFDAPGADPEQLKRIVRGPFTHDEFVDESRNHCVPAPHIRVPAAGLLPPPEPRQHSCSSSSRPPKT